MAVWWSSVFLGRKKQSTPERAGGRLRVDAMRMRKGVSQTGKKWDDQICPCLSRTVMICSYCSGIIILIVPLFTFNGSSLEDILQGYPREKQ